MDPKAVECLLVGYCENSKSFRMWNPVTRKIIISRDVVFREEATYESGSVNEDDYDSLFPLDEVTVVNLKKKKNKKYFCSASIVTSCNLFFYIGTRSHKRKTKS